MRNVYVPMRAANWRAATRRTNEDYLKSHIYPVFEHVQLKDITKFNVQMFLNRMANDGYSYTVVYHARDLIKAGLAEAVDQEVMERNVARKTVIPEIEERDQHVLPIAMYCKLLARLTDVRDRAIFLIGSFCALRPSELFALTWGSYQGTVFKIMNTAWRGQFQPKKIRRKNRFGRSNYRLVAIPDVVKDAVERWRAQAKKTDSRRSPISGREASTVPGTETHDAGQPEVFAMVNQVANRILAMDSDADGTVR